MASRRPSRSRSHSRSRSRSRSPIAEQAIIFTIGRMNPPTSGHMKVVQKMLEKALILRQKNIYLILSHTTGDEKNPLKCSEKKDFLSSGMIDQVKRSLGAEHIKVSLICGDEPVSADCETNWITGKLCEIIKKYDETKQINLYLFIGEDRAKSYNWLITKYNKPATLTHLTILSDGLERPPGAMSGTKMRELIETGQEAEFIAKEMEAGLSYEKATDLYQLLETYLLAKPPAKKKKTIARSLKTGGKKRKRTIKRKNKKKL